MRYLIAACSSTARVFCTLRWGFGGNLSKQHVLVTSVVVVIDNILFWGGGKGVWLVVVLQPMVMHI